MKEPFAYLVAPVDIDNVIQGEPFAGFMDAGDAREYVDFLQTVGRLAVVVDASNNALIY